MDDTEVSKRNLQQNGSHTLRRIALASCAGVATGYAIAALDKFLPYSETKDSLTDALRLPGALVARPFYPEGIHTGSGSPTWGYFAIAANWLFYSLIWYFLIFVLRSVMHRASTHRRVAK